MAEPDTHFYLDVGSLIDPQLGEAGERELRSRGGQSAEALRYAVRLGGEVQHTSSPARRQPRAHPLAPKRREPLWGQQWRGTGREVREELASVGHSGVVGD